MMLTRFLLVIIFLRGFVCQEDEAHNSVITSHKAKVPQYCWNSYETIRCYELCTDNDRFQRILSLPPNSRGDQLYIESLKLFLKEAARVRGFEAFGMDPNPGVGYPCENKCESDPIYWSCIERCNLRDHTALWEERCFSKNLCDYHNITATPDCIRCLSTATAEKLYESCEVSFLPEKVTTARSNLCIDTSSCEVPISASYTGAGKNITDLIRAGFGVANHSEMLRMFVNDRVMLLQKFCCNTDAVKNATMCRKDAKKCDDVCAGIMTARLCRETCKRKRNPEITDCIDKKCNFYYPVESGSCKHCWTISDAAAEMKTCIQGCGTSDCVVKTCFQPVPSWVLRNCHYSDYLEGFANFIKSKGIWRPWKFDIGVNEASWTNYHFTPLDCRNVCTTDPPPYPRACADCMEQERSIQEIEEQCGLNPFRTIEMLGCAVELELKNMNFEKVLSLVTTAAECVNETIRLQLYELMVDFEIHLCDKGCKNSHTPYHPNEIGRMKCHIEHCQATKKSPDCKPDVDTHVVRLVDFATCRWKLDFAKVSDPYVLWAHYFNELGPEDIRDKLEHPDTTRFLQMSTVAGNEAFYTFPYFLIVRSQCDTGFYDDGAYRFFLLGSSPTVELKYMAPTSRHQPASFIRGIFHSSLIKLKRIANEKLIPENPRSINNDGRTGCHARICHPAFAVPMLYLHHPHFDVTVKAQEIFSDLQMDTSGQKCPDFGHFCHETLYVSAFHSRTIEGKGAIQIAIGDYPGHAGKIFPRARSTLLTDSELSYHAGCIANDIADVGKAEFGRRKCPEIVHILDDFDRPYRNASGNPFHPIDAEDVFRSQYTFSTATVQAIAGFYDPRFLIIGDADMNQFEVVNWGKLLKDLERRQPQLKLHPCIQPAFHHRGYAKPMYSQLDRTDPMYPLKYYRQRYAPLPYFKYPNPDNLKPTDDDFADTAIFEAIGMEDRLLLVTSLGLVSFYGQTNDTVAADKAWKFDESEVLNRCFKLVRILRRAQPAADAIVGITYNYVVSNVDSHGPKFEEISQQIWIGQFNLPGQKIDWKEIKISNNAPIVEHRVTDHGLHPGELVPFGPGKGVGLPYETREANPKSQVESICYKAFRTQLNQTTSSISLQDEPGWCEAVDATPVVMRPDTVQVLVRLSLYFSPSGTGIKTQPSKLYFYVVASHTLSNTTANVVWIIDTILPRVPCIDPHPESVKNVLAFDSNYFKADSASRRLNQGCHEINAKNIDHHIFLNGMTYTRTLTNHLFLYGSRLLQSDSGKSFVILLSFPQRYHDFDVDKFTKSNHSERFRHVHRISVMAFDDKGHYAFLTNKLELWIGSTGSQRQIRLRPSPLRSMVQLGVSKERNLNDGLPFSLQYDSVDKLYEMVAIVGDGGHVTRIMKRPVEEWKLLRINNMLQRLEEHSSSLMKKRVKGNLSEALQKPFNYHTAQWTSFCAFLSPKLHQNFSKMHARTQGMTFPQPVQHLALGRDYIEGSLFAFQAATFGLVWRSYFMTPLRHYAGKEKDPFDVWIQQKRDASILGQLKYTLGNPDRVGVLVQPRRYRRIDLSSLHASLIKNYFMDLNVTAELSLEFSIKNDYVAAYTGFDAEQLKDIQLNVENANGTMIQINMEKEVIAHKSSVRFVVTLSVKRIPGLQQNLPGHNLIPVPVTFHLIGAFGNCILSRANGIIGDSIQTTVVVGCPASRDFVFDWNSTLASIKFRDKTEHGTNDKCYDNEFACFFARNPLVLHFQVYDETSQNFIPYHGKYTMRILGGGRRRNSMRNYSREEVEAYNIPGISDVSLVWNEWDTTKHQKVERLRQTIQGDDGREKKRDHREVVLTAGESTIMWACHTLSPCARVRPRRNLEVVFWFRIQITNRNVDNDTLCLFEKEFDLMLYGFPPSPEFQLLTTLGFCGLLIFLLYVFYMCCRNHRRLWRTTKVNARNWFHIAKDSVPKRLRLYEPPLLEEQPEGKKRHQGLGSPENTSRENSTTSLNRLSGISPIREPSSASSLGSGSMEDSSQVLPGGNKPNLIPGTAREIVYDQILSRRLNSIVEKNRLMRQNLIKKVSIQLPSDALENEAYFEKQFGRTVSQESAFTPPMPKEGKRGIDSFF